MSEKIAIFEKKDNNSRGIWFLKECKEDIFWRTMTPYWVSSQRVGYEFETIPPELVSFKFGF